MSSSKLYLHAVLGMMGVAMAFLLVACGGSPASSAGSSSSSSAASSESASASSEASSPSASSGESTASASADASASASSASAGDSATSASSSSDTGASGASASSGSTSFRDSRVSSVPVATDIPSDSILLFEGNQYLQLLKSDMEAGKIPISCNVLYDTMGARPSVTVFDPDTIVELYNLFSQIEVIGESNMSVTDMYHHIYFELQNGLSVGCSFEGEDLLSMGRENYAVTGSEPLWRLVQQIQDEYMAKVESKGVHKITIESGDDLIESYPREAVPGDLVCVRVLGVTDASMHVEANGEEAENWGDIYFLFTMPDTDVKIKAYAKTPPGGGLA